MNYLLHVSLLLGACFLYYRFLLQRETHFQLNRWLLLMCVAASFALPLITIPAAWSLQNSWATTPPATAAPLTEVKTYTAPKTDQEAALAPLATKPPEKQVVTDNSQLNNPHSLTTASPAEKPFSVLTSMNWSKLLRWAYLAGVLVFFLHFLLQIGLLLFRMLRYPGYDLGQFKIVELDQEFAPYSFWNRIFLNPNSYDPDTFHRIVQHEQIHVTQRHSIDILLAELLVVVQWFNPFAWLYRAAIEHNLEFLTDAEMLRKGTNPVDYQLSLVQVAVPNHPQGLTSNYNQTFLEKRITMMKAKKSSARSGWKYLALIPLLLFSVLQLNAVNQKPLVATDIVDRAYPLTAAKSQPRSVQANEAEVQARPAANAEALAQASPQASPVASPDLQTAAKPALKFPPYLLNGPEDDKVRRNWTAEIEGKDVCFQFIVRSDEEGHRYSFNNSSCIGGIDLASLPRDNVGDFAVKRAAGTVEFRGVFEGNEGFGAFYFVPDATFAARLKSDGYGEYKDMEMMQFFFADFSAAYLAEIRQAGYEPDHDELFELAIFGFTPENFRKTLADLDKLGFGQPSLEKLIELRIHGIDMDYVSELSTAGYEGLSLRQVVNARIHGLSGDYVSEMAAAGYRGLSFDRIIEMSIHGISPSYIKELDALGYKGLSADEVVNARIHGLSADRLASLADAGFTNLALDDALNMTIHGIDGDYVAMLKEYGFTNLDHEEVVAARIHGVNRSRLEAYQKLNIPIADLDGVMQLCIHGVSPSYIEDFRSIGYRDMDLEEVVAAKIHGLSPSYAAKIRDLGFEDASIDDLIGLRIHGVSAGFIKENRDKGETLDDFVEMKIHGRW